MSKFGAEEEKVKSYRRHENGQFAKETAHTLS
jgi:hypothetical protein